MVVSVISDIGSPKEISPSLGKALGKTGTQQSSHVPFEHLETGDEIEDVCHIESIVGSIETFSRR